MPCVLCEYCEYIGQGKDFLDALKNVKDHEIKNHKEELEASKK